MRYEVEVKAHVVDVERLRLLLQWFEYRGTLTKRDFYYKRAEDKHDRLRLRYQDDVALVTAKIRQQSEGIAINNECEFTVSDGQAFEQLMAMLNLECYYHKIKKVELYTDGLLNYELVTIEGLGSFIEIEKLVEKESHTKQAQEQCLQALLSLGFTKQDIVEKSYQELALRTLEGC